MCKRTSDAHVGTRWYSPPKSSNWPVKAQSSATSLFGHQLDNSETCQEAQIGACLTLGRPFCHSQQSCWRCLLFIKCAEGQRERKVNEATKQLFPLLGKYLWRKSKAIESDRPSYANFLGKRSFWAYVCSTCKFQLERLGARGGDRSTSRNHRCWRSRFRCDLTAQWQKGSNICIMWETSWH